MRRPLLTALALSSLALVPAHAQSAESEVMAVTHGMLAVLKTRDAVGARALMAADTRRTTRTARFAERPKEARIMP